MILTSLPLGACFPIFFQEEAFLTLTPEAPHGIHADLRAHSCVLFGAFVDVCALQSHVETERGWQANHIKYKRKKYMIQQLIIIT